MSFQKPDIVVVGSGLFGLTIAERCANVLGLKVLIVEKRGHIGGNAWSTFDDFTGIEVHNYGAHLFHTSNERVWDYANRFTSFTDYEHRVMARYNGSVYPMPFNLGLINQYFHTEFSPGEAEDFIKFWVEDEGITDPKNLEEKAISMIGRSLYQAFVKGYTTKQWQMNPRDLSPDIITRLPLRYNYDNRYFTDTWQGQPVDGYAAWLTRMAQHPNISVLVNVDWLTLHLPESFQKPLVVYTGPLDRYFSYVEGRLPWRTVDFEFKNLPVDDYQGVGVMNHNDESDPRTRTIEFKHFHPERDHLPGRTIIADEYSRWAGPNDEPYYPVPTAEARAMLSAYRKRAALEKVEYGAGQDVLFGGRLGTYQYLDMHMAIASALTMFDNQIKPRFHQGR